MSEGAVNQTILPKEYAHVALYEQERSKGVERRDTVEYRKSFELAGVRMCQAIDYDIQRSELVRLRGNLQNQSPSDRQAKILDYWRRMERYSTYPILIAARESARKEGVGQKTAERWNDNPNVRDSRYLNAAKSIYPNIEDPLLVDRVIGKPDSAASFSLYHYSSQLEAHGVTLDSDLGRYIMGLYFMNTARNLSIEPSLAVTRKFENGFHYKYNLTEYQRDWGDGSKKRVRIQEVVQKSEPYFYLAERMGANLTGIEQKLFGEDQQIASDLWKTATFMKTSVLPSRVTATSVREPLLGMLVEERWDEARFYIEEVMAKYPDLLPYFVTANLKIEPDALRAITNHEVVEIPQARREADQKQAKEDRNTAIELLSGVTGRRFLDQDGNVALEVVSGPDSLGRFKARAGRFGIGTERRPVTCGPQKIHDLIASNGLVLAD